MKTIYKLSVLLLLNILLLTLSAKAAPAAETGFLNRSVQVGSETYRYQVFVPREWDKKQKWPVILFLHGAGERGDDGFVQTEVGIGTAVRRGVSRFPAIIVMPQCRKNVWWTEDAMQAQALGALEQSIKEFSGDRERLYLTGISMGGYGTWGIATKYPGKFAALAPVCGGIRVPRAVRPPDAAASPEPSTDLYAEAAKKIGPTPVWIFHGGADKVVPTEESQKMTDALKALGGNVKYTEYENVGHNSWDKAYADPELMKWLLLQKLAALRARK
jgi:predicted peptidase